MSLGKKIVYSLTDDSFTAGRDAALEVKESIDNPDILILHLTTGHDIPKVIEGIFSITGDIPLVGCSAAGIITQYGCDEATHSLCLTALSTPRIRFLPFVFSGLKENSHNAGENIGKLIHSLGVDPNANKLLLLFPDGLTLNATGLYKGINEGLGSSIDIVGGTSGNDFHLTTTQQICNQEVTSDGVSGLLLYGDFTYNIEVSHGSKPMGSYKTITKSEKNIIYEIDNEPAIDFLIKLIGEDNLTDILSMNIIAIGESFEGKGYLEDTIIRAILGFDREKKSIRIGTSIAAGTRIRMTRRNRNKVKVETQNMAKRLLRRVKEPDNALFLYFNCASRGSILYGNVDEDISNLREILGSNRDLSGFFCFGEIAPVGRENFFHNFTGVLIGIE
jgi:hypothetical protein